MNVVTWCAQGLLALVFAGSGTVKALQSKERLLATGQTGVRDYPLAFIRFIAACELLGAVGLILPWATGIAPVLTPLAAAGLGVIMLGAARAHSKLREPRNVATNLTLLALCVLVIVVRWPG